MLLFRNTVVIVVQFSRSFACPRSLADSLYIISLRFPFVNPFFEVFSNFFRGLTHPIRLCCALSSAQILYYILPPLSIPFFIFFRFSCEYFFFTLLFLLLTTFTHRAILFLRPFTHTKELIYVHNLRFHPQSVLPGRQKHHLCVCYQQRWLRRASVFRCKDPS